MWAMSRSCGSRPNSGGDALIAAAAADVAAHGAVNFLLGRLLDRGEERRGLHDLAGLAIAALRHVQRSPGFLHRVVAVRIESFDRSYGPAGDIVHRGDAGPDGLTVDMDGAGPAQRCAAAVFRAGEPQLVAQIPKQRNRRVAVERPLLAIDTEFDHRVLPDLSRRMCCTGPAGCAQRPRAAIPVGATRPRAFLDGDSIPRRRAAATRLQMPPPTDGLLYSSAKTQTEPPCGTSGYSCGLTRLMRACIRAASTPHPDCTAMYCLPSIWNDTGTPLTPEPVRNSHRVLPLAASKARKKRSLVPPANNTSPAVARTGPHSCELSKLCAHAF